MGGNKNYGKAMALVAFTVLALVGAALLVLATNMPENWLGRIWTPLIYAFLIMVAFHFMVMAVPFFLYARDKIVLLKRAEALAHIEAYVAPSEHSLFGEFLSTVLTVMTTSAIILGIYWATHWFSTEVHVLSLSMATVALLAMGLWENRAQGILGMIARAAPLVLVTDGLAFGLFYGFWSQGRGPFEASEIIAWIAPMSYLWIVIRNRLKETRKQSIKASFPAFHSFRLLWHVSDLILTKVRRGTASNQAFAVLFTLLIFVFPNYVKVLLPDGLVILFAEVQTWFDAMPITKDHIPYVALTIFVAFSCNEFSEVIPDVIPYRWLLLGGLYNAVMKAIVGLGFLIMIAPIFILLFLLGHFVLGPDLAVVVGFFTFPSWSQRVFALFAAAFVLSFDNANAL